MGARVDEMEKTMQYFMEKSGVDKAKLLSELAAGQKDSTEAPSAT